MMLLEETIDGSRLDSVHACPICSSSHIREVGNKLSIHPRASSRFSIISCRHCRHWFTVPLPRQDYLIQLYSEGSLSVYGQGWQEAVSDEFKTESTVESLGKHAWIVRSEAGSTPGNYLEIGPGNCAVLRQFEKMGWRCFAIEPGSWSKDKPGFYNSVAQLPDIKFDIAVANDVLEHVSDPRTMLADISGVLNRGARLYSCFPNADSVRARVQGVNWRMVRPIGHVHYFSAKSAKKMLKDCGYKVHTMHTYDLLEDPDWLETAKSLARLHVRYVCRVVSDAMVSAACSALGAGDQWRVVAIRD